MTTEKFPALMEKFSFEKGFVSKKDFQMTLERGLDIYFQSPQKNLCKGMSQSV